MKKQYFVSFTFPTFTTLEKSFNMPAAIVEGRSFGDAWIEGNLKKMADIERLRKIIQVRINSEPNRWRKVALSEVTILFYREA